MGEHKKGSIITYEKVKDSGNYIVAEVLSVRGDSLKVKPLAGFELIDIEGVEDDYA